ncbi:MAG: ParA family protein [Bacteroidales bacterium]|jgi:hypothetical protein|nr:ParA family protein [Bacteroidales bacterium]
MPFIKDILRYKSISFVGMDKNAGKTETLNYVLSRLHSFNNKSVAVTSIGIDGETIDQVTKTSKPKIFIYPNTIFITAENLYSQKQIVSVVEDISKESTSLGRLVSARSLSFGNVLLSGPTNTSWLKQFISKLEQQCDICLIDGALSRKSFASPSITQAMILSTGAVVSASIDKITEKTSFVYQMTQLPIVNQSLANKLSEFNTGIFSIDDNNKYTKLNIPSMLMIDKYKDEIFSHSKTIYVSGMITDKLLEMINTQKNINDYTLIIKDFTHIFSSNTLTNMFLNNGGKIKCLFKANLVAITANPVSPLGFKVNNDKMINSLREKIDVPVYNIKNINDNEL